jgi:cell division protease FtsH
MQNKGLKELFLKGFYIFIILLFFALFFSSFSPLSSSKKESSVGEFISFVRKGEVEKINSFLEKFEFTLKNGETYFVTKDPNVSLEELLLNYGLSSFELQSLKISHHSGTNFQIWLFALSSILPFVFIIVFFWLLFRQTKTGTAQVFEFTRARAKLFGVGGLPKEKVTFKDVAGLKEAKQELMEVVDFLKNPKKYLELGARIPKGILLVGPSGCGKTLLARAVAGEANVPFFSVAGSSFVELFVGVGSGRVRSLFQEAKKHQPCLIFIDELDAIGKVRGPAITGGHEEREQTLNQLLIEMDGFEPNDKCVVLAATNRPDVLDPALLRPGRFDRKIVLDLPDVNEREEILKIHSRGKPLASNVNLREVAERTPGFSGADLANVVNEAALLAARKGKNQISQEELLESIEKVLLGPERKSHVLSKKEKEIAAYHEAGHALVAAFLPEAEPVRKISIVARGLAAGYTLKTPKEEKRIKTKKEFLAEMTTLLGGYVAEKMKFGDISTGASNDLENASRIARKMVKEYGMSSLGPIVFGEKEELIFLGREYEMARNYSEEIAQRIDKEVAKLIKDSEKRATQILKEKSNLLEKLANLLIKKETIEKEEFEKIIEESKKETLAKPEGVK